MERLSEVSEATMALIVKNYIIVLALLGLILVFTLYIYLYRGPLMAEYFTASEKKSENKHPSVANTVATA
jgi:hypothetical protein